MFLRQIGSWLKAKFSRFTLDTFVLPTCVTWILDEADCKGRLLNFFLEQIFLVEEQDDGGIREPLVVADRVEQLQTLLHPVLKIIWGGFRQTSTLKCTYNILGNKIYSHRQKCLS